MIYKGGKNLSIMDTYISQREHNIFLSKLYNVENCSIYFNVISNM